MRKTLESSNLNRLTQSLFFINTATWVLFAIVTFIRMTSNGSVSHWVAWMLAFMMLGNAAAMLAAGLALRIHHRWALYLGIVVLAVNILLTFTDQVGSWDLATLMIDLILLGLLVAGCSQLLAKKSA